MLQTCITHVVEDLWAYNRGTQILLSFKDVAPPHMLCLFFAVPCAPLNFIKASLLVGPPQNPFLKKDPQTHPPTHSQMICWVCVWCILFLVWVGERFELLANHLDCMHIDPNPCDHFSSEILASSALHELILCVKNHSP